MARAAHSNESLQSGFLVAVDLVILCVREGQLCVLLVERGVAPFDGRLALPGGFVLDDEDLETAARRELREETGIDAAEVHLEQLATYGDAARDPRGRVVSVAHLALVPALKQPTGGSDARDAVISPVESFLRGRRPTKLAFDHNKILADGVERARSKLEYSTLATKLVPQPFTVAELRTVYEAVWGMDIDPRNFHRKVIASEGFVEETGDTTTRGGGRPAQLLTAGVAELLHPPLTR